MKTRIGAGSASPDCSEAGKLSGDGRPGSDGTGICTLDPEGCTTEIFALLALTLEASSAAAAAAGGARGVNGLREAPTTLVLRTVFDNLRGKGCRGGTGVIEDPDDLMDIG